MLWVTDGRGGGGGVPMGTLSSSMGATMKAGGQEVFRAPLQKFSNN